MLKKKLKMTANAASRVVGVANYLLFFILNNIAMNTNIQKEPTCCMPGSDCCNSTWVIVGCC